MGKEKASAEKWNDPDYTPVPTKRKKTRAQLRKEEIESPQYQERLAVFETEWSDLIKDAARKSFPFGLSKKTIQTMRQSYWYSRELRGL